MQPILVSVVISTYNNPEWLEKTLWGYIYQTYQNFEIVIADDGSKPDTEDLIRRVQHDSGLNITHVWHPDEGFQKSRILNKAILATKGDYLIFTDQDCIPREDFVEIHVRYAEENYFLSGGYCKLPMETSRAITQEDVASRRAFDVSWLKSNGVPSSFKLSKLFRSPAYAALLNWITPANASWNGCNSSTWKSEALRVNGFNEEMQYGGQDREFGERLVHAGLKSKQIRYSAVCLHLDHGRPYKTPETMAKNKAIRQHTRQQKLIETPNGIKQLSETE